MSTVPTPAQARAGRALLNLAQEEFAERAGISARSLGTFEQEQTRPKRRTLQAIARAFDAAGVEFVEDYGVFLRAEARDGHPRAA